MKNKKIFIIGGLVLLLWVILVGCCFSLFRKKELITENNERASRDNYIGYSYNSEGKVNYYISNGDKFIAFDKETNNKIAEFEIPSSKFTEIISNNDIIKYYVYKDENDNMYKLFNIEGELLKSSEDVIQVSNDIYNNKSYYIYDNCLYGDNGELVYKDILKSGKLNKIYQFYIYGSYLFVYEENSYKMLNLKTKEIIDVVSFIKQDNYVMVSDNKTFYLIDLNKDEILKFRECYEKSYGKLIYNNEDDKKIYTNQQLLNYNDKMSYHGYKFHFSVCEDGFKIYTNNDELISEECYTQFNTDVYGNVLVNKDEGSTYYLKDNKIYDYIPIGKYFIKNYDIRDIVVYNEDKKEVNKVCSNEFSYYKNNLYVCNDSNNVYLVDDNFNKVSDDYDEIICNRIYCQILKDNEYGLLYDKEVVIEPVYTRILLRDNFIIAEDEYKIDIFTIGKDNILSDNELNTKIDDYKNINVEQVIEEYKLEDIEDVIYDNKELFQKYSYVVLNNNGLRSYKKYVLKAFVEVALNKEYLDEKYFLASLKSLSITDASILEDDAAGIYYPRDVPIIKILSSLKRECDLENVVYHELTHFIDDRLNRNNSLTRMRIYQYQNKYVSGFEYLQLTQKEQDEIKYLGEIYYNFLVEGGAEVNSGIYLDNMLVDSYGMQVALYNMLSYIYGCDTMRSVFFSEEGYYLLFKKMVDAGYTFDEIKKFADITNRTYNRTSTELMYCLDMIITLYEKEKGDKWYEDNEFSYFVSFVLPYNLKKSDTKRYNEYKEIKNRSNYIFEKMNEEIGNIKYVSSSVGIYYNDMINLTVTVHRTDEDEFKDEVWSIVYDFENDKIKDYKILREND